MARSPEARDIQQDVENTKMAALNALRHRTRAQLDEELPTDHRLSLVYRAGAGLIGTGLVIFGVLGFSEQIGIFDTGEATVLGLSTNGALAGLSVAIGALLLFGMVRGGNFASTLNIVLGVAFVLSGFANLAVLEREANILNFGMQNVLFSYVVGVILLIFGMYGRVTSRLPEDNPYRRARQSEELAEQDPATAPRAGQQQITDRGGPHRKAGRNAGRGARPASGAASRGESPPHS